MRILIIGANGMLGKDLAEDWKGDFIILFVLLVGGIRGSCQVR